MGTAAQMLLDAQLLKDLAIAGEANSKLCMCHLMVEGSGGTSDAHTVIHEACAALVWGTYPISRRICPAPTCSACLVHSLSGSYLCVKQFLTTIFE